MQKILHIIGGMDRAGAETMVMNLYRKINRSYFQFGFLYFKNKKFDYDNEILDLGGQIYHIAEKNAIKRAYKIWKFLKQHNEFKIVHSHTLFNTGLNLLVAKFAGVPVRIAHAHNTNRQSNKSIIDRIYERISKRLIKKHATNLIACGEDAAIFLFDTINKVQLLYNAIDIGDYHSIGQKNSNYIRNNWGFNGLKIIQIGRIEKVKNHTFTIKLAEWMKQKNISFKFFIIGQGSLEIVLKEEVKNKGIDDVIEFLGIRTDIPQLMAGADVMIMPSLHEGFPVVLVESQAIGLPSLIADTISKEVDLGLSLIYFQSLHSSLEIWANELISINNRKIHQNKNCKILKDKGFDVNDNARTLENIYNEQLI
jgi:glycosyltransferase EpsF